jgi:hypothetical protein
MWHAWERSEKCTRFWWERQKERDHLEDGGVGRRVGSKQTLGTLAGFWHHGVSNGSLYWPLLYT